MNTPMPPTQDEIRAAWESASARFGYPPIKQSITIICETHPQWKHDDGTFMPFVRISAIPEYLHGAIHQLSRGSTVPYIDDKKDCFYTQDIIRWLRALGIHPEFINDAE